MIIQYYCESHDKKIIIVLMRRTAIAVTGNAIIGLIPSANLM